MRQSDRYEGRPLALVTGFKHVGHTLRVECLSLSQMMAVFVTASVDDVTPTDIRPPPNAPAPVTYETETRPD